MEWVTARLTAPLRSSDVVGCGWVREEEGGKGNVYFTLNGQRTENSFTDAPPGMIPFLHIQKKVCTHEHVFFLLASHDIFYMWVSFNNKIFEPSVNFVGLECRV